MIRASTFGFEVGEVRSPHMGCLLLTGGGLRIVGCLLPPWGALGRSLVAFLAAVQPNLAPEG